MWRLSFGFGFGLLGFAQVGGDEKLAVDGQDLALGPVAVNARGDDRDAIRPLKLEGVHPFGRLMLQMLHDDLLVLGSGSFLPKDILERSREPDLAGFGLDDGVAGFLWRFHKLGGFAPGGARLGIVLHPLRALGKVFSGFAGLFRKGGSSGLLLDLHPVGPDGIDALLVPHQVGSHA